MSLLSNDSCSSTIFLYSINPPNVSRKNKKNNIWVTQKSITYNRDTCLIDAVHKFQRQWGNFPHVCYKAFLAIKLCENPKKSALKSGQNFAKNMIFELPI